jgi:hypothetical protein
MLNSFAILPNPTLKQKNIPDVNKLEFIEEESVLFSMEHTTWDHIENSRRYILWFNCIFEQRKYS